ncbi:uncharacterized protein LOC136751479 [Amia ocellicauda]|uniref:uncharacterized protein LOC136751479 n=1 Tax=Amia ocellicauda TaxID=2972642 RepID=UPI00346388A2
MAARGNEVLAWSEQCVIWETEELVAYLDPRPWTPGATVLTRKAGEGGPASLFELPVCQYSVLLQGARAVGELLCQGLGVQRCALLAYPRPGHPAHAQLLPLHGLSPCWEPKLAPDIVLQPLDPGYCSSRSGPRAPDAELARIQAQIRARLPVPTPPSHVFLGDPADGRLFSRLVRGEEPQWRVWEDSAHVAFLTPFPHSPGCTVVVPRRPLSSDLLRLPESEYGALILCTRQVALLLQEGLDTRGCALVFEGYEVDYAHAKLYPLIRPPLPPLPPPPEFCPVYPGYVTSVDGPPASAQELRELQARLTQCS